MCVRPNSFASSRLLVKGISIEPDRLVYYGFYVEGEEEQPGGILDFKTTTRTVRKGFVTFPVQLPAEPDPVKELMERVDVAGLKTQLHELGEQAKTELVHHCVFGC